MSRACQTQMRSTGGLQRSGGVPPSEHRRPQYLPPCTCLLAW